jgi:hypothetical protein
MSPIVVTNSSPSGRVKRVKAPTPSGGGGGLRANAPVGFTVLSDMPFSGAVASTGFGSLTATSGINWGTYASAAGRLTQVSDATARQSAPDTVSFLYPTGLPFGENPGGSMWFETGQTNGYRKWYESLVFRIGDAGGFETQLVGVKALGYWGAGANTGTRDKLDQFYMIIEGNGSNTSVMTQWLPWFAQQGPVAGPRWDMNMNTGTRIIANTWHELELVMESNTIGSANGVLKVWLDGVQIMNHTTVTWIDATYPIAFHGRKLDPIWGGGGGANRSRDDRTYFDHSYISGEL